jgi:PPOX class probable F420-dependent enzyme
MRKLKSGKTPGTAAVVPYDPTNKENRMAKLNDSQLKFLEQPFVGIATTLRKDGSPHNTVVWVDVEDGVPAFNTALGRVKPKNLERDPRVALTVVDPSDSYKWLAIDGRAELTTDGADPQIDKLAKKYLGKDEYPWRKAEETRVKVRIQPEHITAYGLE